MKKTISFLLVVCLIALMNVSCEEAQAQTITPAVCYSVETGESELSSDASLQLSVDCPTGMKAFGAGWSVLDETGAILEGQATYFQPSFDGSGWLVNAKNQSTFASQWKLRVRVICGCEAATEAN